MSVLPGLIKKKKMLLVLESSRLCSPHVNRLKGFSCVVSANNVGGQKVGVAKAKCRNAVPPTSALAR